MKKEKKAKRRYNPGPNTRTKNKCEERHTPLSPHKNRIRRNWLEKVHRNKYIVTVSHALLDALQARRHKGGIQIFDTDPGVRRAAVYLAGLDGGKSDYPDLKILPPMGDIRDIGKFCDEYGVERLGAVDVDLAMGVQYSTAIFVSVLKKLIKRGYQGPAFLTFRNGRKEGKKTLKTLEERLAYLKKRLPKGAKFVRHDTYVSTGVGYRANRYRGVSMCIVEIHCNPSKKK